MRKLFVILVAIFLMASSAYAMVETANNGPQQETTCYVRGIGNCTSGNVVVLTTTSATRTVEFPGREVTFSTTQGNKIYGIVTDTTDYDMNDLDGGKYIKVLVHGYAGAVVAGDIASITRGSTLVTSATRGRATYGWAQNTGNCVAFDTATITSDAGKVVNCFLSM